MIQKIPSNHERAQFTDSLLVLWEASVKATHSFLTAENIESLKPIVKQGIQEIPHLYIAQEETNLIGFAGVDGEKLEMLFLSPQFFGKGVGRKLLEHVIANDHVKYIDVNEQNPNALAFYEHCGFVVCNRSPLDGQGNSFPILHLTLKAEK